MLVQQDISEPVFYGDLVYQFKLIVEMHIFTDQFKISSNVIGYKIDIMRLSACLVINPITVYIYGFLFNYTTVDRSGLRLNDVGVKSARRIST